MHVPAESASRPQRTRWGHWSVPFQLWFPLSVYVASRLISAAFIIAAAGPAHRSGYSDMATAWDGDWYRYIATTGYPTNLPTGAGGQVLQNPWAFSPGYPLTVRALMAVTRQDFSLVAPTLSLALGAAAIVVIFVLLERAVSRFYACACVILTCTFMATPSMQIAYAESLALLLLASALLLLREHKYFAVAALLLALALTRPVVLAFIPVVIAHGVTRWRRQESDPFPAGDRRAIVLLTAWCVAVTALWPVIVAVGTRDVFAWTKTHEAWRVTPHFAPGLGWPASFFHYYGWPALALLAFVVLVTLWIGVRPGARAWGTRAADLDHGLPRIPPAHHRSRPERDPLDPPGLPADVAVPGEGDDQIRTEVPGDSDRLSGGRRAGPAVVLGLLLPGRQGSLGPIPVMNLILAQAA